MKYNKENLNIIFIRSITIFIFLFYWEFFVENFIVPKPTEIFIAFIGLLGLWDTWNNILLSSIRVYVSIAIALVLGIIIGSLDYFRKELSYIVNTFFYPSQYIASAVWSIIAIVLFGLSAITVFFVIVIVIIPNIFVAVQVGLKNINKEFIEFGKSHTTNKLRLFRHVIFPQILPHLLIGLIRTNAIAWKIVVTAELFISVNGLGFMVNNYYRMLNIPKLFATVLMIVLIGLIFDSIFKFFKKKIDERYAL